MFGAEESNRKLKFYMIKSRVNHLFAKLGFGLGICLLIVQFQVSSSISHVGEVQGLATSIIQLIHPFVQIIKGVFL